MAGSLLGVLGAPAAHATYPGSNGVIPFIRYPNNNFTNGDVFTVDPSGTNVSQRTFGANVPCLANQGGGSFAPLFPGRTQVSPNGNFITVGSANGILIIPTTGPPTATIVPGTGPNDCGPAFTPDGQTIVYFRNTVAASGDGTLSKIQVFAPGGNTFSFGGVTTLFGNITGARADVSPDGQRIAFDRFVGGGNSEVFTVDINGGAIQQVTNCVGGGLNFCVSPSYSPNGQFLALTRGVEPISNATVAVVPSTATGAVPATLPNSLTGDFFPAYSPDGCQIAASRVVSPFGIVRISAPAGGGCPTPNNFGRSTVTSGTFDTGVSWATTVQNTTTTANCTPSGGGTNPISCTVTITGANGGTVPAGAFVSCVPNGNFAFPPSSSTQTTGSSNTVTVTGIQGNPGFNTVTCYFNGAQGFNTSASSPQNVQISTAPPVTPLCARTSPSSITVTGTPGTFVSFYNSANQFMGYVQIPASGTIVAQSNTGTVSGSLAPTIACVNNSTGTAQTNV